MGLEIVEHVDQPQQFLKTLASLTQSDGALFISTINRTPRGYVLGVLGAEYIAGVLPTGAHDWDKFLTPGDCILNKCNPAVEHIMFSHLPARAATWSPANSANIKCHWDYVLFIAAASDKNFA